MEVARLQRMWTQYVASLRADKILDEQFTEIWKLQDESTPKIVFDIFSLFFQTSAEIIGNMTTILETTSTVDFKLLDSQLHQLKGSSQTIGAMRMKDACAGFITFCAAGNSERCRHWLQVLKFEWDELKDRMDLLFAVENRIVAAGGSTPTVD